MLAAVGGLEQPAAGAAGAEGPALAAEVPERRIEGLGRPRIHGQHGASGGSVGAGQDFAPRLAAVAGFVDAALVVIVPEMSGGAGEDGVAVGGVDEDFGDVLGILEPQVGPVLAAIGGFIDAVPDGDAVANPAFAAAHPDNFGIGGVDGDGADGLHRGVIEHRFETGAGVDRFPDAAAGGSGEHGEASAVIDGGDGGDAAAHLRRADVARRQTGDCAGVEAHRSLGEESGDGEQEGESEGAHLITPCRVRRAS